MIEPPPNASIITRQNLTESRIPVTVRLIGNLVAPLIRRRRRRQFTSILASLREYQDAAGRCQNRAELEAILGPPRWVCSANEDTVRGNAKWLDRVERYEPAGTNLRFDALFASPDCPSNLITLDIQGDLMLSSWDRVADVGTLWEQFCYYGPFSVDMNTN